MRTVPELRASLGKALADTKRASIINIVIDPMAQRKPQVFIYYLFIYLFIEGL